MNVPFVDLPAQDALIRERLDEAMLRVAAKANFILGDEIAVFESEFARYVGSEHAVGVASGLAALELILRGYGIGPGDEVVVPAHTFVGSAACVSLVGATPVFADVDETFTVDPASVRNAITPRTKAIIAVHLYGRMAQMEPLRSIAEEHGLRLIEDAAQAHGASLGAERVGAVGDAAAFSFYPSKNLGASGDAGAVTSNDGELVNAIRAIRNCGQIDKGVHSLMPCNHRMDTVQAAVLSVRLTMLEQWNAARRRVAGWYAEALEHSSLALPPVDEPRRTSVWHLYVVKTPRRDRLARALADAGVGTGIHYPLPVHRQPFYLSLGYGEGSFPVAERACRSILSLPMHPSIRLEQVQHISSIVEAFDASG